MSSSSGSDGPGRPRALDAVDPGLLDLLVGRHGAPRQATPLSFAEQERRRLIARRERAIAAADPALVHQVERHARDAARLRRLPPAEPTRAEARPLARFDLDAWPIRQPGGEPRELEPSDELRRTLTHRTPQAFLRDLHRPVTAFGSVQLRRVASPTSSGSALARIRDAVRGAMAHHSRDDALQPLATHLMQDGMRELRTILARPWGESRPANPLPMPRTAPAIEDSVWFGLTGGYDPDV